MPAKKKQQLQQKFQHAYCSMPAKKSHLLYAHNCRARRSPKHHKPDHDVLQPVQYSDHIPFKSHAFVAVSKCITRLVDALQTRSRWSLQLSCS
jgi:hypothetical protein